MQIQLSSTDAVVIKNSIFDVKPHDGKPDSWNPETHAIFKDFIGKKAQSLQISDQKNIFKTGGAEGDFDSLPFGTTGKLVVVFVPNEVQ